jgi:hypothetical protein
MPEKLDCAPTCHSPKTRFASVSTGTSAAGPRSTRPNQIRTFLIEQGITVPSVLLLYRASVIRTVEIIEARMNSQKAKHSRLSG